MDWTPRRIRLFRDVGLCLSQERFSKTLGFTKRTIGNAERGSYRPSLALCSALDQALERASDAQRDRFLAAIATEDQRIAPRYATAATFPVTSYADTAYLEAVHNHIRQIVALDGRFGGTDLAPLVVRFFRSVHHQLGTGAHEPSLERDLQAAAGEVAEVAG